MKSGLFANEPLPPAARRAIVAGFVGFAVDFFDIYLPALVLVPVMGYFEPKGLNSTVTTTIYYFTIVATLLGRPCGAVIFGHWADKIGRRRTTMISIAGFGFFTALIAFLPGDDTIGVWSLALLIAIRFVGGIFMGGEYTSNNTMALEMVPKDRRGFVGGLIQGAFPLGFLLTTVVTTTMLSITTKDQYYAWGWRVPFLIGFAIAMAFLLYYRTVPESTVWQESEKSAAPLKEVLSGSHLRTLGQIFIMMTGFWFVGQPSTLLPSIMIQHLHVPSEMTSNGFLFASIGLFFAFIGYGLLSQMIGRRRGIIIASTVVLVAGPLLYYAMIVHALSGGSPLVTTILAGAFHVVAISPWGIVTVYICERFPTHVRASGYGIGYSLAVVIPSFSGIYVLWIAQVMPYLFAPIVLLVLAGVFMIAGAMLGPETRGVELHLPDLGLGRAQAAAAPAAIPRPA
ncbi:MAG TPA: MFS transporter [Acetobacteraceae bacterium]|nr:MFS transporter [Acetobacteraceae bacterium]